MFGSIPLVQLMASPVRKVLSLHLRSNYALVQDQNSEGLFELLSFVPKLPG